jgi:crotonobetainyl-CoA:carnitine CoA-transferase CaiB-like acyl-CoA transferase
MENRELIVDTLTEIFAHEPIAVWQERLAPSGIPCTPIMSIDQVARQEQVAAREMIVDVSCPDGLSMPLIGVPIKFSGARGEVATPPPRLGEHTKEILLQLGLDAERLERLSKDGVVAPDTRNSV